MKHSVKKLSKNSKSSKVTQRTYNFQKNKTISKSSDESLNSGYKPIKNPQPVFEMRYVIQERAGDEEFILRNNRGQQTERFVIDNEIAPLKRIEQEAVVNIAKLLGFRKPIVGSAYRKAVQFLKDKESERFTGRSFESAYNSINNIIHLHNQYDAAKEQQAIRNLRGEM